MALRIRKIIFTTIVLLIVIPMNLSTAAYYGSKTSPILTSSKSGASYGTYSISGTTISKKLLVNGYIKDNNPGGNSIYVYIEQNIAGNPPLKNNIESTRYNVGNWVKYPQLSSTFGITVSTMHLYVCEDKRFQLDDCSAAKLIYKR